MKKGISLIVLVITIIVMIIIAGAIIISLSQENIVKRANDAVEASDEANAKYAVALVYADILAANNDPAVADYDQEAAEDAYQLALDGTGWTATADATTLKPIVSKAQ